MLQFYVPEVESVEQVCERCKVDTEKNNSTIYYYRRPHLENDTDLLSQEHVLLLC